MEQLLYSKPPQVKKIRNPKLKRQVYQLLPPVIALRSMHEASAPSITSSDMKANAGLSSKGAQRRARAKVREFKKTARRALYPIETMMPVIPAKDAVHLHSDIERSAERLMSKLWEDQKEFDRRKARRRDK